MSSQALNPEVQPEVHHLALRPPDAALVMQRAPEIVLQEAALAAKALRDLVEAKPKKVVLNGKTFLQFEDWLTVARFYGITVASRVTNYVERGRVVGYECHAEAILVSTGQVIGAGQAECLDDEKNWNMRAVYRDGQRVGEEKVPLFQLRSMAQTRAQAKALRSILSWVVVLAGYAPTPAEEMDSAPQTQRPIAGSIVSTPMHPDKIRTLFFEIRGAKNMHELQAFYFAAGKAAKAANDRDALESFIAAKDERKAELQC